MPTAAQEVAGHLLDFGITDPELTEPAAALLLAVGLAGRALELQGRLDAPEARERLTRQAADQAVLHPERASAAPPEIREGAARVRAALEALEAGDEAKALAGLRDVARSSPFADWRLFARGLAAFRRRRGRRRPGQLGPARPRPGAVADRPAPWPRRPTAARRGRPPRRSSRGWSGWAFGEPVLGPLRELGALVAQDRWPEAVRMLGAAPVRPPAGSTRRWPSG